MSTTQFFDIFYKIRYFQCNNRFNKLLVRILIKLILNLSGIFLIVVLLGYGLVNIPKILIINTNYEFKLELISLFVKDLEIINSKLYKWTRPNQLQSRHCLKKYKYHFQ